MAVVYIQNLRECARTFLKASNIKENFCLQENLNNTLERNKYKFIYRNLWKILKICRSNRKILEDIRNRPNAIIRYFRKKIIKIEEV